jgi:ribonuclease P protein component
MGEATVSAEQPASGQATRLSAPDVDASRPGHSPGTARQGPSSPVGLIWRVRDRATLRSVRATLRVRRGALSVRYLPPASADPGEPGRVQAGSAQPPRVAFGIGRGVGTAVVRKRLRRQLREVLRLAPPPAGVFLVDATPDARALSFPALASTLAEAINEAVRRAGEGRGR